jgi:hypothetical protein
VLVLVLVLAWHRMAPRRHLSAALLLFRMLRQQEKLPLLPPQGPPRRSKSRVSGIHLNLKNKIKNLFLSSSAPVSCPHFHSGLRPVNFFYLFRSTSMLFVMSFSLLLFIFCFRSSL